MPVSVSHHPEGLDLTDGVLHNDTRLAQTAIERFLLVG